MKLVERISQQNSTAPAPFQRSLIGGAPKRVKDSQAEGFQQLKLAVHNRLFETLDVTRLESLEPALASQKVTEAITAILEDEGRLLTETDKSNLIEEIKNELLGLGPLEPLLWDDEITDILVNGHNQVYVEKRGKLHPTVVEFQRTIVRALLNILVCGGTGSGKTTMLNCLSLFIPADERIVTIEDSAELMLQQPHVVRLETRPPNVEGKGEVSQRDLVRNSLRMRPDRIIVGEVRGGEVFDMLQAMSTGHDGSIATIHANTPRDSMGRLEMMR